MFLVLVSLIVKPEFLESFLVATLKMAQESLKEQGTRRFEVIRRDNDPGQFVVYIAFNSRGDHAFHLTTPHMQQWLTTVTPMLAAPLQEHSYTQLF